MQKLTSLRRSAIILMICAAKAQAGDVAEKAIDLIETPANHWSLSVEVIALKRSHSNVNQTLTYFAPSNTPWASNGNVAGTNVSAVATPVLNSNQLTQGYQVGPKLTLRYSDDSERSLEVSYFNVLNMHGSQTTGPNGQWLTMYAPGLSPSFWQTQDFPNQSFVWTSTTNLYSAEANAKLPVTHQLRFLAGLRWVQLNDSLTGGVTPADPNAPIWKRPGACGAGAGNYPTFQQLQACGDAARDPNLASSFSTFWMTSTTNNLLGLQLGGEGNFLTLGALSLEGALKAGVYNNRATQSDWVSMSKQFYYGSATRNRAAYVADATIQLRYQLRTDVALKLGYQLLWMDQVALAPGQISQTYSVGSGATGVTATGVNGGSNILFQGGTVGVEVNF